MLCQEQNCVHIFLADQVLDQCIRMDKVKRLASENGVVIFTKSSCCLCYAVNILFQELGANPLVYEIDHDPEGREIEKALLKLGCNAPVPAVFIAGKLIGSTNEIMSLHLSGSLTRMLKGQPLSWKESQITVPDTCWKNKLAWIIRVVSIVLMIIF